MAIKISVQTSDNYFSKDLETANIDGITISNEYTFAMDSAEPISINMLFTMIITAVGTVATERLIDWFCDHLKKKLNQKTMVNGHPINIANINITEITKIVLGNKKDGGNDN